MKRKTKIAVIGAGGRTSVIHNYLLKKHCDELEIVGVFDPDSKQCDKKEYWFSPNLQICRDYREAIDLAGVDWVMVFSPNAYHAEHIIYAFSRGKHVFSEKPLATSIEDCQNIHKAHRESGKLFATGFVLRYAPIYQKAKEVLDSGHLGKLLSLHANENIPPDHGGFIMRNWRRFTEVSGPHILEKCCHDLDLINWFTQSLPTMVASIGKLDFFVPENENLLDRYGNTRFGWPHPHALPSPFTSEKNLLDNQTSIAKLRNKILVSFQNSMNNVIPERRMYFNCTEGTMILDLYTGILRYKSLSDQCEYMFDYGSDGHGGGDEFIMESLYDSMINGTLPKCSGNEGLESAVFALALDEACKQGKFIDLEPVWKQLNR